MNTSERDVTHSEDLSWQNIFRRVLKFAKHPVQEVAHIPDWPWQQVLLLALLMSMVSGAVSGLIPPNFYHILAGIFLFPILSTLCTFILALFFYYFFQIFERKTISFKSLFTLCVFVNIPFFVFRLIANILPFITVLGFALTAILLVVGLVENFGIEKKRAIRLIAGIFVLLFAMWAVENLRLRKLESSAVSVEH